MISARVTITNPKTNGEYVRYSRSSTLGDCVKACLNAVDQRIALKHLPDTYHIKVELDFDNMDILEDKGRYYHDAG